MQVVVDKLLTHYEVQGTGPVLLLIHGWADRLETFDDITSQLASSYTVVRLDLPGFGTTEPPRAVWGLEQYAQFVGRFLKKVDIPTLRAIVGHSNGGAVAVFGLAEHILHADTLVLLAAAGVRSRHTIRKRSLKVIAKAGKLATCWLPHRLRQRLRQRFYGTIGSDMLVAPHLQETFKRTVAQDIQPQARKLTLPTLLVYGDTDTATPVNEVGTVLNQAITGSTLHVIPGADHFVHQRASDQVVTYIREFLA